MAIGREGYLRRDCEKDMKRFLCKRLIILGTLVFTSGPVVPVRAGDLEEKVQRFLESHKDQFNGQDRGQGDHD